MECACLRVSHPEDRPGTDKVCTQQHTSTMPKFTQKELEHLAKRDNARARMLRGKPKAQQVPTPAQVREAGRKKADARERKIAANLSKAAKSQQISKPVAKTGPKTPNECPSTAAFAAQISRPFEVSGQKGIKGVGNVSATDTSFPVMTTVTKEYSVLAGAQVELGFWPGHGSADLKPIDSTSIHSATQLIGGLASPANNYVVGPLTGLTSGALSLANSAGYSHAHGANRTTSATTTTTSATSNIAFDQALAHVAQQGEPEHTRWRLVGMGIRVWNVSKEGDREGKITVSQPDRIYQSPDGNIKDYFDLPHTTYVTELANEDSGLEVIWLPRSEDLGFNHSYYEGGERGKSTETAAIKFFIENAGAVDQLYSVSGVFHWEISGNASVVYQTSTPSGSFSKPIIEEALSHTTASSSSGAGFAAMVSHASAQFAGRSRFDTPPPRIPSGPSKVGQSFGDRALALGGNLLSAAIKTGLSGL